MKSVTIVTSGAYPIPSTICGSVEISVMNMLPYLASSFTVTVIGRQRSHVEPSLDPIPFVSQADFPEEQLDFVQIKASSKHKYSSKMVSYIKSNPTTFVQVENRPRFVLRIKKEVPEARIWLMLHSVNFISPKRIKHDKLKKVFQYCERIVVNSHFLKNEVLNRFPDLNLHSKVLVNPLGVNADYFRPGREPKADVRSALLPDSLARTAKLHSLQEGPVILFVGRLIKMKGIHHLLEAMSLIRPDFPRAKLLIIGSSRYGKQKQTAYVQQLDQLVASMQDSVILQPHVSHLHLPYWYRLGDLFVCPSLKNEALGLVNLEAMACQLPVIATNIGGIPEIVVDNHTGHLISPDQHVERLAEAMHDLLSNPDKAKQMGRQGREHVLQNHSWEISAQRLIKDYQETGRLTKRISHCLSEKCLGKMPFRF